MELQFQFLKLIMETWGPWKAFPLSGKAKTGSADKHTEGGGGRMTALTKLASIFVVVVLVRKRSTG